MARRRRPVMWASLIGLLVAVVAAGVLVVVFPGLDPVRGTDGPPSSPSPSAAYPVPALLASPSGALGAYSSTAPVPTRSGVLAALRVPLADRRLGRSVSMSVLDGVTGEVLLDRSSAVPVAAASTTKLVTATAALATLGPEHVFTTQVVAGARPGDVVLVGGGDPTLAAGPVPAYAGAAHVAQLAARVRAAHPAPITRVLTDSGLFSGPLTGPGWDGDIVQAGFAAPITALMVDGGRRAGAANRRSTTPDLDAGRALAAALHVPVVARGSAPAGAAVLGAVSSAPLRTIVEQMLAMSDNVLAETLNRHVALARHQPPTFVGGAAASRSVLAELALAAGQDGLVDGSGLSRLDRVSPSLLAHVLALSTEDSHPELRWVLTGLPVAAYSGTLAQRFAKAPAGVGVVRAKTGTLSGVSSLAGEVVDSSGRLLVFAVVADAVPAGGTRGAEAALDRIAATLAICGCR